jgi:dTDP-4-amino-4,6-dideoxygalactose transaminase
MIRHAIDTTAESLHPARELERKLADLVPLKHFMATGFTRNALVLLARALEWDAFTEVIVPAFTCSIIRHTIEAAGARPVPVDAEQNGLNIDPDLIEKAITGRTRAVYVVHTYGTAARMERICAVAKRHNLAVIEDAAHAPFYRYHGRQLGTWGDYALYSFTKKTINYEGGAIGTNNTAVFNALMSLRDRYQEERAITAAGIIDGYVRLVGSWWEKDFSIPALCLMKLNDLINKAVYRGSYGVSIDRSKFKPDGAACRITLRQLDALHEEAGAHDARYRAFREGAGGPIGVYGIHQDPADTPPRYFTGSVQARGSLMKLISFRTWRNSNVPGSFPRADYLYEHYRVFSKAALLFGRRGERQAPALQEAPGR